jgi:hypothetical protein
MGDAFRTACTGIRGDGFRTSLFKPNKSFIPAFRVPQPVYANGEDGVRLKKGEPFLKSIWTEIWEVMNGPTRAGDSTLT